MDPRKMQQEMDRSLRSQERRDVLNPNPSSSRDYDFMVDIPPVRETGVQTRDPLLSEFQKMRQSLELVYSPQEVRKIMRNYKKYTRQWEAEAAAEAAAEAEAAPADPGTPLVTQLFQGVRYVSVGLLRGVAYFLRMLSGRD
ncbi:hypothetical protein LSTR_LSTR011503 [Laodelphax striatellus]|uniref:Uncharacterized protein n=1 Tax=Laodelphax striatellus TaxID=195883 RepID=A0A482WGC5_LAOST|nr:hypothetical protein LSTR_LSTR011503 [Laodelphax striatellus]